MPCQLPTKKMIALKPKPMAVGVTSVVACVVLIGMIKNSRRIAAQDLVVQKPRYETTYREIRDGNVTRRVPETRVVYPTQIYSYMTSTFTKSSKPLPHVDKIGPLVASILGNARVRKTKKLMMINSEIRPMPKVTT